MSEKKKCPLRPFKTSDHVDAEVDFQECMGEQCAWHGLYGDCSLKSLSVNMTSIASNLETLINIESHR